MVEAADAAAVVLAHVLALGYLWRAMRPQRPAAPCRAGGCRRCPAAAGAPYTGPSLVTLRRRLSDEKLGRSGIPSQF